MNVVDVNVANGYKIVISRGIIGKVGEKCRPILPKTEKILIVSDSNVTPLYLAAVRESFIAAGFYVRTLTFEAGEKSKTLDTFGKILNVAASLGFCRDDAFVALGGGVVGDLTGFAAACYMRGIRYVQIPTSLLAAIDSSVGGKTGADIDAGKNLVGAFHQPSGVFFDPDVLSTLPEKEWKNGLGEGVKYAVLCGGRIAEILETDFPPIISKNSAPCASLTRRTWFRATKKKADSANFSTSDTPSVTPKKRCRVIPFLTENPSPQASPLLPKQAAKTAFFPKLTTKK